MRNPMNLDEVMTAILTARRYRLRELIDQKFGGQQSRFVEATGINQGELSGLLKTKHFGEKKARSIELQTGMPYLYLDQILTRDNVIPIGAREPDTAEQIAATARQMSPQGQWMALGAVQQLAKQYPAAKPNEGQ